MSDFINARLTENPHTFYLKFAWHNYIRNNLTVPNYQPAYLGEIRKFVNEIKAAGLNPMLKTGRFDVQYITFRSKHDAMAFKLGWT